MRNLIPHLISEQYKQNNFNGSFEAYTMFVDISGFTKLTETLMLHKKDGAEVLTDVLNSIFDPIVEKIYQNNGMISTFAGDAFTAIFPVVDEKSYETVLTSAKYINSFFKDNKIVDTKFGKFDMGVKVGISYGGVKWGILGKGGKHTYYFRGEAIDGCAKSEHHAEKGDIIIDNKFAGQFKNENPQSMLLKSSNNKIGDNHLKLDASSIEFETSKQIVKEFELKEEDLTPFTLDTVIFLKNKAEFREVVSVFISFDEPDSKESLNIFTTELIKQSYNYGGYFNKIDFGDKGGVALLIFGAPISYENNIERALNFILDIKNKSLNINFRAGITSGTVYAGIIGGEKRCEYTAIGDIVNLSARFMMKSKWGEFWVSKEILNNQQAVYEFKDLGVFEFKGKSGKIPAYKLIKKKEKVQNRFFDDKIFGREEELKKLKKFVEPIFKTRKSTGILYIYGEAGIGKSRLVYELKTRLTTETPIINYQLPPFNWFYMPCEEIIRKSFNPIIYFLTNYFDLSIENTKDKNKAKFELKYNKLIDSTKNNEIKKELVRITSIIGGYLGIEWENSLYSQLDAKGRYENFLFAFTTFIQAESLINPIIIEIEDTHWIDSDSEKLLKILTRNTKEYSISIICPSRYSDNGSEFKLNIDKEIETDKIDLNFLKKNSISEYGKDILETENDFSSELLDFIYEKTNGNPFFVEQILLDLQDRDVITVNTTKKQMTVTQDNLKNIPSNIQAVVISRLDRLSNDIKNIVQTASVLGREFFIKILTQVLKYEKELDNKLLNIEDEKIWSPLSEMNYLFKHALLRDSAYDMQLRSKLKELHKFAAESYIEVFGEGVKEHYAIIAFHYEKAEIRDKTMEYLEKAGDFAKEIYQNEKGIEFYERLISLIKKTNLPLLSSILIKKGRILQLIGKWDDAFSDYELSLKISEELKNKNGIANAIGSMGVIYRWQSNYPKAMGCHEKQLKIAKKLGNKNEIASAIGNMGVVYAKKHNYSKAMEYYEKGLVLFKEMGSKEKIATVMGDMGDIYRWQSNYSKAVECYEKLLKISEELGNKSGIARAVGNIGVVYAIQGNYSKAIEYFNQRFKIFEELGNKNEISRAIVDLGIVYSHQGNHSKAMKSYEKGLNLFEEMRDKMMIAGTVGMMGKVYSSQGNHSKAIECYEKQLKISEELEDKSEIASAIGNMGGVYSSQDNYSKAMECYEKQLKIAEKLGNKNEIASAIGNMGIIYANQSNYSKAIRCYKKHFKIIEELGNRREIAINVGNTGVAYYSQGKYLKAIEYCEKALVIDYELNLTPFLPPHLSTKTKCLYKIKEYIKAKEINEKCYNTAKEVENKEYIFSSNILKEKIEFKLSENSQDKKIQNINNLKNMLKDEKEEKNIALLNYELAIMNDELKMDNSKYKKVAIEIYKKLYEKTPNIKYKNKFEELETL